MTVHFDTLDYANTLEGAGMSRAHAQAIAKVQAKALADLVANDLVTKDFLRSELIQVETRLRGEITMLGTELRGGMLQLETRIEARLRQEMDTLRLQLRSLQYGGTIAVFAISAVVLISRLIR